MKQLKMKQTRPKIVNANLNKKGYPLGIVQEIGIRPYS